MTPLLESLQPGRIQVWMMGGQKKKFYFQILTFPPTIQIITERLSVRRIIVGCILAMNDRPTDLYTDFICWFMRFKVQHIVSSKAKKPKPHLAAEGQR